MTKSRYAVLILAFLLFVLFSAVPVSASTWEYSDPSFMTADPDNPEWTIMTCGHVPYSTTQDTLGIFVSINVTNIDYFPLPLPIETFAIVNYTAPNGSVTQYDLRETNWYWNTGMYPVNLESAIHYQVGTYDVTMSDGGTCQLIVDPPVVPAKSVYYPAKGDGAGTFTTYTGVTCTNLGASSPCARYNEGSLRIDMDLDSVKYQVQNSQGTWRYIQYDIPNPTNLIPSPQNNPKSLIWTGMYANNTNLRYVMQSHGIKLDIWGSGTPPSNYFNFTYTLSAGVTHRMQGEEILFLDSVTGEPLWLVKYPTMHVNDTNVPLTFKKDGNKISIHAPDLFTNPEYNFSAGWELDPSTQSGSTIYIADRHNLTEVNADIANASALQDLGGGEWLLNADLINNNTANRFCGVNDIDNEYCGVNGGDLTWLKINSTNTSGTPIYWYYLTNGQTEFDGIKITSWNTTSSTVENLPVATWARSAVYASGASSKMNISNSNLSYLGYNAVYMSGVSYFTSSYNQIINNSFLQNYRGIYLESSSNNNLTSNNGTSTSSVGIYLSSSSNYNTLTSNIGTSTSGAGIYLGSSSNNNLTSNTVTSTSYVGILLSSSSNNNLTSNTVTSTSSVGIYLSSSSNYNTLTSNNGTSTSSVGIYLSSSSNNNLTSNTFNTNSTTTTVEDIYIFYSSRTNRFINTDFTTKPRKIEFNTVLTSEFNQSQDSGISFVNTNLSIAGTTNRSIINWNQSNITWTETFTGTTQANYSATGLLSNTDYQVYNGTTVDYELTTDASGNLPVFTINFTTTVKTVQILQVEAGGTLYERTAADSITVTEGAGRTLYSFRATSDAISVSENADRTLYSFRSASDSIAITEGTQRIYYGFRSVSDAATFTEYATATFIDVGEIFTRYVSDAITVVEGATRHLTYVRLTSDSISITEGAQRVLSAFRSGTDSITLTDSAVRIAIYNRAAQQAITLSENIQSSLIEAGELYIRYASDTITITEGAISSWWSGVYYTVSGYVYNILSSPLEDARVEYTGSGGNHSFTDAAGYYSFIIPAGDDRPILSRAIGYRNSTEVIDISGNTQQNFTLSERTAGTVTTPGFSAISGIFIIAVTLILVRRNKNE